MLRTLKLLTFGMAAAVGIAVLGAGAKIKAGSFPGSSPGHGSQFGGFHPPIGGVYHPPHYPRPYYPCPHYPRPYYPHPHYPRPYYPHPHYPQPHYPHPHYPQPYYPHM